MLSTLTQKKHTFKGEKFFFGIDGGGTKSRLAVSNENKTVLCTVSGGSTNMYAVGFQNVCANILGLFDVLQKDYGICPLDFSGGCFASAGLGTEDEKEMFRAFFAGKTDCPVFLCTDALAALAGGTGKAEGLIVISGTGSIAAGLRIDGKTARAGGLGHLISDEGSGFRIGLDGIRTAFRAYERRAEKTLLTDILFEHYKSADIRDLFSFLYTEFDKAHIASFCPRVFDAARLADMAALRIIDEASNELALLAKSTYLSLFAEDEGSIQDRSPVSCVSEENENLSYSGECVNAVFSGGVFEHEPDFSRRTAERVHKLLPRVIVRSRLYEPVYGACILAQHAYQIYNRCII